MSETENYINQVTLDCLLNKEQYQKHIQCSTIKKVDKKDIKDEKEDVKKNADDEDNSDTDNDEDEVEIDVEEYKKKVNVLETELKNALTELEKYKKADEERIAKNARIRKKVINKKILKVSFIKLSLILLI